MTPGQPCGLPHIVWRKKNVLVSSSLYGDGSGEPALLSAGGRFLADGTAAKVVTNSILLTASTHPPRFL